MIRSVKSVFYAMDYDTVEVYLEEPIDPSDKTTILGKNYVVDAIIASGWRLGSRLEDSFHEPIKREI